MMTESNQSDWGQVSLLKPAIIHTESPTEAYSVGWFFESLNGTPLEIGSFKCVLLMREGGASEAREHYMYLMSGVPSPFGH